MSLALAAALRTFAVLAAPDVQRSDFIAPCEADLDERGKAQVRATAARRIRRPSLGNPVPVHWFRGAAAGCARVRFTIGAAGHLQNPVVERSHPDARFGLLAVRMLSSAVFAPDSTPSDVQLMVVGFRLELF